MIIYHLVRTPVNGQFVLEKDFSSEGNPSLLKLEEKSSRCGLRNYRVAERSGLIPARFSRLRCVAPFHQVMPKRNRGGRSYTW